MVVAGDAVPQGAVALLDALDGDRGGERVSEVLELLVGGDGGEEETVAVARGEAPNDAGSPDGGVDHGDVTGELGLEDAVEVLGGAHGDETVGVGETGEDPDVVGGLETGAEGHGGGSEGRGVERLRLR